MRLSDLESLQRGWAEALEGDGWTLEKLATAQTKDLTSYRGIGKITAERVIKEAANLINTDGLKEAKQLAIERYYQKTPPWKIVETWEEEGLPVQDIALSSIQALATLKGINDDLAAKCISEAQTALNKRGLYESRQVGPMVAPKTTSPAFPPEWLSGEVVPPPMGIRIKRVFDEAKREYEAANG